jgi:hypothetical protein
MAALLYFGDFIDGEMELGAPSFSLTALKLIIDLWH